MLRVLYKKDSFTGRNIFCFLFKQVKSCFNKSVFRNVWNVHNFSQKMLRKICKNYFQPTKNYFQPTILQKATHFWVYNKDSIKISKPSLLRPSNSSFGYLLMKTFCCTSTHQWLWYVLLMLSFAWNNLSVKAIII